MATYTVQGAGADNLIKFTATATLNVGDKLSFNGALFDVVDCDGKAFTGKAWDMGDEVILSVCNGFVKVLAPLQNKVNKETPAILGVDFVNNAVANGSAWYCKDGMGFVTVSANFKLSTGEPLEGNIGYIQLPVGFRPYNASLLGFAILQGVTTGSRIVVGVTCYSDGCLQLQSTQNLMGNQLTARLYLQFLAV